MSLLRKNRISPRLLLEDNARVSVERFADLQVSTMLAMEDEALGYAGRRMPIGCWSMMCHAVIGSENLGQALARFCRFYQLFEFGVHPHLEQRDDVAVINLRQVDRELNTDPYLSELVMFNVHRFSSWLVQEHLPILRVELGYPPSANPGDYRHMFLGNPVEFDCTSTRMTLGRELLEKRVTQNEASLRHFLRHPVLIMLTGSYASDSWTAKVRELVHHRLADMPELKEVAARLEVHPQTLRRRLVVAGTAHHANG